MGDKCPVCGYDEWDKDEDNEGIEICRHCGYERGDLESEYSCENCGEPLMVGDEIIHQGSGTMGIEGPNVGDHFYMHAECPEDKLDRFKQKRIKEVLEQELEDFNPQYICQCNSGGDASAEIEEMWPKADLVEFFDEIRFILRYGMSMGELGNIPGNWGKLKVGGKRELTLRRRADKLLKKLMKEEGFE